MTKCWRQHNLRTHRLAYLRMRLRLARRSWDICIRALAHAASAQGWLNSPSLMHRDWTWPPATQQDRSCVRYDNRAWGCGLHLHYALHASPHPLPPSGGHRTHAGMALISWQLDDEHQPPCHMLVVVAERPHANVKEKNVNAKQKKNKLGIYWQATEEPG